MQIYADVLQRRIEVAGSQQSSAFGASMWASLAGGIHPDIHVAAQKMVPRARIAYEPERKHRAAYDALYAEYSRLHDLFGRDPKSPMKQVRRIQKRL
jgi:L-ribulokinase